MTDQMIIFINLNFSCKFNYLFIYLFLYFYGTLQYKNAMFFPIYNIITYYVSTDTI